MRIYFCFFFFFFIGCQNKDLNVKKGTINIYTSIFHNASKSLDDYNDYHVSKLFFVGDRFLELVPNYFEPSITDSIYFIDKDRYYHLDITSNSEINDYDFDKIDFKKSVFDKKHGAIFLKDSIDGYSSRENINDTIMNNIDYNRFTVINDKVYTVFWVQKIDSILPYSLNKIADNDYGGRISRIDSYDRLKDKFVTIKLDYDSYVDNDIYNKLKTN